MKKIVLIASLALLASACATDKVAKAPATTAEPSGATAAITAAETAQAKAAAVGYEWRDTGKMIAAAKKAAAAKESDKAVMIANMARRQSENALVQHAAQKDAGNRN